MKRSDVVQLIYLLNKYDEDVIAPNIEEIGVPRTPYYRDKLKELENDRELLDKAKRTIAYNFVDYSFNR